MSSGVQNDWSTSNGDVGCEYIPVAEFYADKSVFITGATGFLGKVLVEKLLRSCPKIKNIYLLIRPKRGQDVASRIAALTQSLLFENLRQKRPQDLNKILPIKGDIAEPQLGISAGDQAILCQQVSVVFHSAATVKFNEKLKLSVTINLLGTKQLVQLCHRMTRLEALVHVSTAYCNCEKERVEECVYPPPVLPESALTLVELLSDDLLDKITPELLGDKPNTYTFTKALSEDMLIKECRHLPVAIVRPSIGKGLIRTMMITKTWIADLIPVDNVTNLMIVSAWKMHYKRSKSVVVYNCCSGNQNPITWQRFLDIVLKSAKKNPFNEIYWYPGGDITASKLKNNILSILQHRIPALIIDFIARAVGKNPIMVKVQDKLGKAITSLEYFGKRQWSFLDDNVRTLCSSLSEEDRLTFDFNVRNIDWDTYIESYVLGIKKFLLKESPDTLSKSRKLVYRLYVLHVSTQVIAIFFMWRVLLFRFKTLKKFSWSLFDLVTSTTRLINLA